MVIVSRTVKCKCMHMGQKHITKKGDEMTIQSISAQYSLQTTSNTIVYDEKKRNIKVSLLNYMNIIYEIATISE